MVRVLVPYYCARNNKSLAFTDCMRRYQNINVTELIDQTKTYELEGLIDSTGDMSNDRVYIFSGMNDSSVVPGTVYHAPAPVGEGAL